MQNDTTFDYVYEFYGSSAKWYGIYAETASLFIITSNLFFITLTMTTKSLRTNVSNWFLVGFSLADLLHSTAQAISSYGIFTGTIADRYWCKIGGVLVTNTGTCSFGFPALLAAERYYKITTISQSSDFSLGNAIFDERRRIPLIVGWFFFSIMLNLPLMLNDTFGENPAGFCGTKKFTSVPLFLSLQFSVVSIYAGSLLVTAIYYYRLVKWLKTQAVNSSNKESIDHTSGIMRVTKFVTLIPLITAGPTAFLLAGEMVLPVLPMWIYRLIVAPYFLSSGANSWLTIGLIRHYRERFLELVSNAKRRISVTFDGLSNSSSTPVRRI